ncbi:glutamic acid-rich protein-like [Helianthus annuus]|uniref:glutamic acid-rich protein-like n=1 Tax=Helianthus annuus TaxID=4232 RepID=UPI001652F516|nr:glutamic acid-rich protein-like [Helianthus annuus]
MDPRGNPVVDPSKVDFEAVTNLLPSQGTFNTRRLSEKEYLPDLENKIKEICEANLPKVVNKKKKKIKEEELKKMVEEVKITAKLAAEEEQKIEEEQKEEEEENKEEDRIGETEESLVLKKTEINDS